MKKPEFWLLLCGAFLLLLVAGWTVSERKNWFSLETPELRPTMVNALVTFGPLDSRVVITPQDLSTMTQDELTRLGALIALVEFYHPTKTEAAWLGQKLLPQYIDETTKESNNSLTDKE